MEFAVYAERQSLRHCELIFFIIWFLCGSLPQLEKKKRHFFFLVDIPTHIHAHCPCMGRQINGNYTKEEAKENLEGEQSDLPLLVAVNNRLRFTAACKCSDEARETDVGKQMLAASSPHMAVWFTRKRQEKKERVVVIKCTSIISLHFLLLFFLFCGFYARSLI